MIITLYCSKCENYEVEHRINVKVIPQDFTIRWKCEHGHDQIICLGNPLYSLLYDNSIIAFNSHNYRACIFEAASSLERFFEHAIRIFIIPFHSIGDLDVIRQYNDTWKIIRNMSERQLGAFVFLFFKLINKAPFLLSENLVALRNKTIHKGYIPNMEEANNFLRAVYEIVQNNRQLIKPFYEDGFWLLNQRVDFENLPKPEESDVVITYHGPDFFNSIFGMDFNEGIKRYYNEILKS